MSEDPTHYGNHDATVALRLELHREKSRADAFEAALRREVLTIVRDEIRKALEPKMIEATYVVSPEDAERIKRRLELEKGGQS